MSYENMKELASVPVRATSPIQELPVETLTYLFKLFLDVSTSADSALVLRLVCRHWCAVAEATPELWSSFVTEHGLEWTRRAISWTKSVPLDVTLQPKDGDELLREEFEAQASLIFAELPRIRHLTYLTSTFRTGPRLDLPAHQLEMFNLDNDGDELMPIDNTFFCTTPPRLTHVVLSSASLSKDCLLLKAPLTHLELRYSHWAEISGLLSTLSCLPDLESFIWTQDVEPHYLSTRVEPGNKPVEMGRLLHFEMAHEFGVISAVMKHIVLPPACNIVICAEVQELDTDALLEGLDDIFIKHLSSIFPHTKSRGLFEAGFRELNISDIEEDDNIGFTTRWTCPDNTPHKSAGLEFTITFPVDEWTENLVRVLVHLLEHWPGVGLSVHRLTVEHSFLFEEAETWRKVFACVEWIYELTVEGEASSTLPEALSGDTERRLNSLCLLTLRDADVSIIAYQVYISEMESRRVQLPVKYREPYTISFIDCTIMYKKIPQIDVVLREKDAE